MTQNLNFEKEKVFAQIKEKAEDQKSNKKVINKIKPLNSNIYF